MIGVPIAGLLQDTSTSTNIPKRRETYYKNSVLRCDLF